MSRIEPGCTAIVVKSLCPENIGKIVKVGSFIGWFEDFTNNDNVEVNQLMTCTDGIDRYAIAGKNLQRIDHHPDNQKTKVKKELEIVE